MIWSLPGCCRSVAHCEASFRWRWRRRGGARGSSRRRRPPDWGRGRRGRSALLHLPKPCKRSCSQRALVYLHMYVKMLTWGGLQRLYGRGGVRVCFQRWRVPALPRSPHKRSCARDQLKSHVEWEPGKYKTILLHGTNINHQNIINSLWIPRPPPLLPLFLHSNAKGEPIEELVSIKTRNLWNVFALNHEKKSFTVQSSEPDTM